jgi:cytochrome P450
MFIAWTLYLLLRHPPVADAFLRAPRRSAERKSVLQKGLRPYPSFPINVRQNIAPMELGGGVVAPRTNLLISPYLV